MYLEPTRNGFLRVLMNLARITKITLHVSNFNGNK